MISEERFLEILRSVEPDVIKDEPIIDGLNDKKRPLVLVYVAEDFTITETRIYNFPADHAMHASSTSIFETKMPAWSCTIG